MEDELLVWEILCLLLALRLVIHGARKWLRIDGMEGSLATRWMLTMERTASLEGIECMEGVRDAGNWEGKGGSKRKGEWRADQPMRYVQRAFAEHDTHCSAMRTSDA